MKPTTSRVSRTCRGSARPPGPAEGRKTPEVADLLRSSDRRVCVEPGRSGAGRVDPPAGRGRGAPRRRSAGPDAGELRRGPDQSGAGGLRVATPSLLPPAGGTWTPRDGPPRGGRTGKVVAFEVKGELPTSARRGTSTGRVIPAVRSASPSRSGAASVTETPGLTVLRRETLPDGPILSLQLTKLSARQTTSDGWELIGLPAGGDPCLARNLHYHRAVSYSKPFANRITN
jgi:hypothetical protein